MGEQGRRRVTPDAVWVEARKAWEGGETARLVAKRYDVGVPALWKRREAEGWKRPETRFGPIEPAEGWDDYARKKMSAFEGEIESERELAADLLIVMQGGPMDEAPMWHLGFLYAFRAEHLGPEVAAADRARAIAKDQPWVEAFWDTDGRLRCVAELDEAILRLNRRAWRHQVGLPDGVAPDYPSVMLPVGAMNTT